MATNPDSIERDPTPIRKAITKTIGTAISLRRVLLLGTIAAIISTAPDPAALFGSALITAYAAVEGKR